MVVNLSGTIEGIGFQTFKKLCIVVIKKENKVQFKKVFKYKSNRKNNTSFSFYSLQNTFK